MMMRGTRLGFALLVLAVTPVTAFAQAGITPLMTGPDALGRGEMEVRGYFTIEDDIDILGVYRRGMGGNLDFGVRVGYTGAGDGGFHFGGDLRYELPVTDMDVEFALAGGLQASFMDLGNLIAVPFGVSIGTDVGNAERSVILYGLPFLEIDRIDPSGAGSDTELEFGVELGGEVEITRNWVADAALSITSHDGDSIHLALGVIWRR
ncbi:MAG: hypothetical protein KAJ19_08545 [Gammaproteobacteria bacterium]|nr:hypothetical protein [Gammaproteobacteria bacterium]